MMASPDQIAGLIDQLVDRGIDLGSDRIVHGRALLGRLTWDGLVRPPVVDDLLALSGDQLVEHTRHLATLTKLATNIQEQGSAIAGQLVAQIAVEARDNLDLILDQLRPDFDAAALVVRQAVEAGIRPRLRADEIIDLGDDAVAAWRGLAGPMATLTDIASLRIRLADVLDAEPMADHGYRPYASCFTDTVPWRERYEGDWDQWLRLSASQPVHLMTVADTRAAANAMRAEPWPSVVEDEDGHLVATAGSMSGR